MEAYCQDQAWRLGYHHARSGGVTYVQRFGSALHLNPHLHLLMLDGVYRSYPDSGQPTFVAVSPPTDEQIQQLIEPAAVRLIQQLKKRGVIDDRDGLERFCPHRQPPAAGLRPLAAARWAGLSASTWSAARSRCRLLQACRLT